MNDTKKSSEEKYDIPQKDTFTLAELEEYVASAKLELYLELHKSVISSFAQYGELKKSVYSKLLSNVLLDMDVAFSAKRKGK